MLRDVIVDDHYQSLLISLLQTVLTSPTQSGGQISRENSKMFFGIRKYIFGHIYCILNACINELHLFLFALKCIFVLTLHAFLIETFIFALN